MSRCRDKRRIFQLQLLISVPPADASKSKTVIVNQKSSKFISAGAFCVGQEVIVGNCRLIVPTSHPLFPLLHVSPVVLSDSFVYLCLLLSPELKHLHKGTLRILCVYLCPLCSPGGLCENTFYVDYRTEDGSANAGSDYQYSEGTLVFKPGDTRKEIKVSR